VAMRAVAAPLLGLLLLLGLAGRVAGVQAPYCRVVGVTVASYGITELVEVRPTDCPPGRLARVHKVSTVTLEGRARPVLPVTGAYTIPSGRSLRLYVGLTWLLRYWDGRSWVTAPRLDGAPPGAQGATP
jgi:hypothetical protein